jgi:serine/threonine protein kinase
MSPESEDTRVDRSAAGGPRRLGRFETVRILGRGGMGSVYLAEDRRIGRQVAIKEIRIERGVSATVLAEARVRFEVELRAAGRLSHPNIATVYDAFETEESYCIALEYVPGISLDERLKAGLPPLTTLEVAALGGQIASGLDYAHRRGIVHRDVKPGNILLSEEGDVKITDFGIAKLAALDVTQTGIALGTPAYMSPEQIRGEKLDGRADQFSLGVLLYQMLTGRLPFDGANAHSMLYSVLQAEPQPPGEINAALSSDVDRVLAKALAKDPADRFATCGSLATELAAALAVAPPSPLSPGMAAGTAAAPFESSPRPTRSVLPWALGCLGVLAALVVAAFFILSPLDWAPRSRPAPRTIPTPGVTAPSPAPTPAQVIPEPPQNAGTPEPQAASPGPIAVEITSEPGRCHLTIDGRHAGFTPLTQSLDPGKHQFTCAWPGQGKRSFEETISPQRRRLQFRL